jgi:hypothetical protein
MATKAIDLLARFSNGQRVRERLTEREGVIAGTGLGGTTSRGGFRPHLNVRVKFDDGREVVTSHHALELPDTDKEGDR